MTNERSTAPVQLSAAVAAARAAVGTPAQVAKLRARIAEGVSSNGLGEDARGKNAAPASETTTSRTHVGSLKSLAVIAAVAGLGAAVWISTRTAAPAPTVVARAPSAPVAPKPEAASLRSAVRAEGATELPSSSTPAAATAERRIRTRSAPAPVAPPSARTTAKPAAPDDSEVQLITRAQALLDSQPAAALAALLAHERLYPRGILAEERDVLRIDAEWGLGQRAAALSHARAFIRQFPRSAQTRRIDRLLSDHKNEAEPTRTE
jgi:hypothetical protein